MLHTKEFYEIMAHFERMSKNFIRTGKSGFQKEHKENWVKQCYYCDGVANEAFIVFLNGYSYGKSISNQII